ncbi:unnamed protein product [marine sediment metagenome]|uniref:Uncharacterized protein n=1 Tax=marine sediment metagenome TaxID=412755 RepID=X1AHK0_9ZZZZ
MTTITLKSDAIIDIDGTDENADWTKTSENRKSEKAIHDALARKHKSGSVKVNVRS